LAHPCLFTRLVQLHARFPWTKTTLTEVADAASPLPYGLGQHPLRRPQVVQEAAIASAVAHPHVVSVFSVGLRPCRPPQQEPAQGDGRRQQAPDPPAPATPGAEGDAVLWQLTSERSGPGKL
jgi:hypothetical protein